MRVAEVVDRFACAKRVVILYDFADPVVRAILEAMPDGSVIPG